MHQNEETELEFSSLIAQRYSKKYHIVDEPAVSFSLAQKSDYQKSFVCDEFQKQSKKQKVLKSSNERENVRGFYEEARKKIQIMLKSLYNCFSAKKFALSEFFQYQQLVLSGFLQGFVNQIRTECRQKGDFLEFIWTETMKMMQYILSVYQSSDQQYENTKNIEIISMHNKYNNFLQVQATKMNEHKDQNKNLKQIVSILIDIVKSRRKQVKKLMRQIRSLSKSANWFKDKCIQLYFRYINQKGMNEVNRREIEEIGEKKNLFNEIYTKILALQNSIFRSSRFTLFTKNDDNFQISDFIREASVVIGNEEISEEEIRAEIDTLFERIEEDVDKETQNNNNLINLLDSLPLDDILQNKIEDLQTPRSNTLATQTTHIDKINNHLIKTRGTMYRMDWLEEDRFRQADIQCNENEIRQFRCSNFTICNQSFERVSYAQRMIRMNKECPKALLSIKEIVNFSRKGIRNRKDSNGFDSENEVMDEQQVSSSKSFSKMNTTEEKRTEEQRINIQSKFERNNKNRSTLKKKLNLYKVPSIGREKVQSSYDQQTHEQNKKKSLSSNEANLTNPLTKQNKDEVLTDQAKKRNIFNNNKKRAFSQTIFKNGKKIGKSNFQIQRPQRTLRFEEETNTKQSQVNKKSPKPNIKHKNTKNVNLRQNREIVEKVKYFLNQFDKSDTISLGCSQILKRKGSEETLKKKDSEEQRVKSTKNRSKENRNVVIKGGKKQEYYRDSEKEQIIKNVLNDSLFGANKVIMKMKIFDDLNLKNKISQLVKNQRKKNKGYQFEVKKIQNPIKHNYLLTIVTSTYTRAYLKMQSEKTIDNFLDSFYESMLVLYGGISKQQMEKKIVNCIAQIGYEKNDNICQAFIYFLGMDQNDQTCHFLTKFDNQLHLKLIEKLSLTGKPLANISQAATNYQKLTQILPIIFKQQKIPQFICSEILESIKSFLQRQNTNQLGSNFEEKKLNVFYCSKMIIKQIIAVRNKIKGSFEAKFSKISKVQQNGLQMKDVCILIKYVHRTTVEQMRAINSLKFEVQQKQLVMNLNEVWLYFMRDNILSFEHLYLKTLQKYGIASPISTTLSNPSNKLQNKITTMKTKLQKQIENIKLFNVIEMETCEILEQVIGKNLSVFFNFSVLMLSHL